jgi:hypothetical protein
MAIGDGKGPEALGLLAGPLEQHPDVLALWKLAADAFRAAGVLSEARACEARFGGTAPRSFESKAALEQEPK